MRKCWNCGAATDDENSRVCSDEICQRAEMKSQRGDFKHKKRVEDHNRWREYRRLPEIKERKREYMREYQQRPEAKERRRERERKYRQRPEVKERQREYMRKYRRSPQAKKRRREYMREYRLKQLRKEE